MKTESTRLSVSCDKTVDVKNVTHLIDSALSKTAIRVGLCLASTPHTTCGLMINEYETGLVKDIERLVSEMLQPLGKKGGFQHDRIDNNALAHLTSGILGRSLSLPIRDSALNLGTWQSVLLIECDGPRTRTLDLLFMGE